MAIIPDYEPRRDAKPNQDDPAEPLVPLDEPDWRAEIRRRKPMGAQAGWQRAPTLLVTGAALLAVGFLGGLAGDAPKINPCLTCSAGIGVLLLTWGIAELFSGGNA